MKHHNRKINVSLFTTDYTKESSLILGLIFSDGHIRNSDGHHKITVNGNRNDLELYYPIFLTTGNWKIYFQNRQGRLPQATIQISSIDLCKFLIDMNYGPNNPKSTNIIKAMPEDMRRYFYRGLIDGDGCFYINRKNGNYQFSLAGSFDQDWSYFTDQLDALGINYTISKRSNKKGHKRSDVRITKKSDVILLGNYIYNGYEKDHLGLLRKYNKFLELK